MVGADGPRRGAGTEQHLNVAATTSKLAERQGSAWASATTNRIRRANWVRIAATYPSQTVGVAYQNVGNCSSGIGYDIEVGVVREHSDYYEADTIDADDSAAIVQWQVDDMEAVRRAIVCCDSLDEKDFILGMYQPIGPQGGLVGGAWMVHVSVV